MIKIDRKIVKEYWDYNSWVVIEILEDYFLCYVLKLFWKWLEFFVVNIVIGGIFFLVLEVIGGFLVINYGFINFFWVIIVVNLIIFLVGFFIVYYVFKYNIDIDLLIRGVGFGYIGLIIIFLIYVFFIFIFFVIEVVIMV